MLRLLGQVPVGKSLSILSWRAWLMRICSELVSEKFRAKLYAFSLVHSYIHLRNARLCGNDTTFGYILLFAFYSNFEVVSLLQRSSFEKREHCPSLGNIDQLACLSDYLRLTGFYSLHTTLTSERFTEPIYG